jgi:carboxyl-terminal processing protease
MKKLYITFIAIIIIITACKKVFFDEDISNTPLNNFEMFWNDFNRFYPFFEIKNLNWDSVYSLNRTLVTNQSSETELLKIFTGMIKPLRDGHVLIYSNHGTVSSYPEEIFKNYYSGFRLYPQNYLSSFSVNNSNINYWNVLDHNIGYMSINTFNVKGETFVYADKSFEVIDEIIQKFKDKDGIIIDMRWNRGGLQPNFEAIADRFTDRKRLFVKVRSKNGIMKNDFSDWVDWYIEPKGPFQFNKPVVVLTSRKTGSASEWFTLAMKTLPNVTTVGDTTNGSFSPQIHRELPNGWSFALSTQIVASADYRIYEGTGIPPDSTVVNTIKEFNRQVDAMMEKGIEIIEKKKQ